MRSTLSLLCIFLGIVPAALAHPHAKPHGRRPHNNQNYYVYHNGGQRLQQQGLPSSSSIPFQPLAGPTPPPVVGGLVEDSSNLGDDSNYQPDNLPNNPPVNNDASQVIPSQPEGTNAVTPPQGSPGSTTTGGGGGGGGKKGASVHEPTLQVAQQQSISWYCNWSSTPFSGITGEYVPQWWGPDKSFTPSSSQYALYWNEPEMGPDAGGSDQPIGTVISSFRDFKTNKAAGKKVSTQCVNNSDDGRGLLEQFLDAVTADGLKPDVLCFHWYGPDLEGLQEFVNKFKQTQAKYDIAEIWLNEWGTTGDASAIPSMQSYLDGAVDRYAYNLDNLPAGASL